jgi:hypothetical protein
MWSGGQSSWLQIQRSGFDSRRYQIFWEVVGLERGPLSLVSTIEDLLGRKNSFSGLENREYGRRDPSRWPFDTFYPQKLALTSPTSGSQSAGIVRLWTKATEFVFLFVMDLFINSLPPLPPGCPSRPTCCPEDTLACILASPAWRQCCFQHKITIWLYILGFLHIHLRNIGGMYVVLHIAVYALHEARDLQHSSILIPPSCDSTYKCTERQETQWIDVILGEGLHNNTAP